MNKLLLDFGNHDTPFVAKRVTFRNSMEGVSNLTDEELDMLYLRILQEKNLRRTSLNSIKAQLMNQVDQDESALQRLFLELNTSKEEPL